MSHSKDENLVQHAKRGDAAAFAALIRRHEGSLAGLIRHRVRTNADADDVLQNTLLSAWSQIERLREPSRFRAWLLQIARNECSNFYRSPRHNESPVDQDALHAAASRFGRGTVEDPSEIVDLRDAVDRLPVSEKEAVNAFYLEGLTIAEIAKRTRSPEGTVKRRLYSARHHLRRALEDTENE